MQFYSFSDPAEEDDFNEGTPSCGQVAECVSGNGGAPPAVLKHIRAETFDDRKTPSLKHYCKEPDRALGRCSPQRKLRVLLDARSKELLVDRALRRAVSYTPLSRLNVLLEARQYSQILDEVGSAELSGEISEFCALNLNAVLAMAQESGFAIDYLEMAMATVASPYELAIVVENFATYELQQGNAFAAAQRCLAALNDVWQTEGLWINLLIALSHLGEMETIDSALRSLSHLDDEGTARLVRLLSSESGLSCVRDRPTFRSLVNKRASVS